MNVDWLMNKLEYKTKDDKKMTKSNAKKRLHANSKQSQGAMALLLLCCLILLSGCAHEPLLVPHPTVPNNPTQRDVARLLLQYESALNACNMELTK